MPTRRFRFTFRGIPGEMFCHRKIELTARRCLARGYLMTGVVAVALGSMWVWSEEFTYVADSEPNLSCEERLESPTASESPVGKQRGSCAEASFVVVEHVSRIEASEARARVGPIKRGDPAAVSQGTGAVGDTGRHMTASRACLVFVRREPSLTDRLCLAICSTEDGYVELKTLELSQFNQVVFRGRVNVRMFGPTLQFIEIRLRSKVYTDVDSLVECLKKSDPEAVAFQEQYKLGTLQYLTSDDGGLFSRGPEFPRFLYISAWVRIFK